MMRVDSVLKLLLMPSSTVSMLFSVNTPEEVSGAEHYGVGVLGEPVRVLWQESMDHLWP